MDNMEKLKNYVQDVNRNNEIFRQIFIEVSEDIKIIKDLGDLTPFDDAPALEFIRTIIYNPRMNNQNERDLTMKILDIIFNNLSNGKDMYELPSDNLITNYDKLKDIMYDFDQIKQEYKKSQSK